MQTLLQEAVICNCGSILTVKDVNLNYVSFNNSFLDLLGIQKRQDILNKSIYDIFDKNTSEIISRYSTQIIKTLNQNTYKITVKDKIFKVQGYPVIRKGELKGLLSIASDITQEEMIKSKLVKRIKDLNQKIKTEKKLDVQKEMFLATLTHDLKTPLQSQIRALELLNDGRFGNLNVEQKEITDMLLESSEFMRELLYSVLTVYKYDNGLIVLNKTKYDINEMLNTCIAEITYWAKGKNIRLEYKNFLDDYSVFGDEKYMRRVFSNIINNAVNYAYKDTFISIIVTREKEEVSIKIKNLSSPISEDLREHIFDKYISGMNQDKKLGIGLGLYFCKKVIEAHKGKIYLRSNNIENEFVVNLPITQSKEREKKLTFS